MIECEQFTRKKLKIDIDKLCWTNLKMKIINYFYIISQV